MTTQLSVERLDQWVTTRAAQRADAPAVTLGDDRLTYGQLEDTSNRLARVLMEGGCRPGDRVALLTPKSPAAIAAILAIYKAGAVYVPLDPAGPARRQGLILHSCEPRWILAVEASAGLLEELLHDERLRELLRVGWLDAGQVPPERIRGDFSARDLPSVSEMPVDSRTTGDSPAHILYTSGSTGTPKGVVITHLNVIHFVEWAVRYFDMQPGDRISGHSPLTFDLSVFDIFGTFASGGELYIVPPDLNVLPHRLAEFIRAAALTQWFSVPSVLNYMTKFDVVRPCDFPALRRLLWCGEVFPTPALAYWMRRLPHVRFTNLYGPTETTIASSYYTLPGCPDDETAAVPIGTACPGEELLVLDDDLRPLPPGQLGELYIGGAGLSPGYWQNPERTQAAFLVQPQSAGHKLTRLYRTGDLARRDEDGLIYFVGRVDSQIKSRGYRIELGEVETAVRALEGIADCAVVAVPSEGFEGTVICCAYVPANGATVTPARLRTALSRALPGYMLPFRWLAFDVLPRTANGKVDRGRLKEAFRLVQDREAHANR